MFVPCVILMSCSISKVLMKELSMHMLAESGDTGTPEEVVAQLLQEEPPLHTVVGYEG